jgi:hypothetical protein
VYLQSGDVDVTLKGLSLFDCLSCRGAVYDNEVRAVKSGSNLTSLRGESGLTGAVYQGGSGGSMDGSMLLLANCSGGCGCFVKEGGSAVFRDCLFVGNSVGAIAHFMPWDTLHYTSGAMNETRLESCCFINAKLRGDTFMAGSVLVDSCLFAGEVQTAGRFITTGVQIGFTSTEISFDTASLLPLCDEYGKFHTPKGPETPRRTGTPVTGEGRERENVLAMRKARIIPFVVLHLTLLALGFTL